MELFSSTPPINDDPEPFMEMYCNNNLWERSVSGTYFDRSEYHPRSGFDRPRAHRANGILLEWRGGRDPYELLLMMDSRWSLNFTDAEREHAIEVIERYIAMRRLDRHAGLL